MNYVTVLNGYTYVTDLPVKRGDVVVAEFGSHLGSHRDAYLLVDAVGSTKEAVGCDYGGPLKQVKRKVAKRGKEAAAIKRLVAARGELDEAETELALVLHELGVRDRPRLVSL